MTLKQPIAAPHFRLKSRSGHEGILHLPKVRKIDLGRY
jgi:hypothetical protein